MGRAPFFRFALAVVLVLSPAARAGADAIEAALDAWDTEGAAAALTTAKGLSPERASYLQGRVAFEQGRYKDAVEYFLGAGGSTDAEMWTHFAQATVRVLEGNGTMESAHFIVSYPRGNDSILVPWTLDALEAQRAALERILGYAPPGKTRVELLGSTADLSALSTLSTEAIRTTGTVAICKFSKLMVTSPRIVLTGYDWMDTLAHEYTHLVVSRKSRNSVPIWMHEGIAKYLESAWRGPPGASMTPSSLALLGARMKRGAIIPFAKMHPSMALLPTAEDAAVAFSEVFFAVQLIHREGGPNALEQLLRAMAVLRNDKQAVEQVTKRSWPDFERAWMASLRNVKYARELIPRSSNEKMEIVEGVAAPTRRKGREVSFGDFAEVAEAGIRRDAHLGELLRERNRNLAAAEAYERAWRAAGDRYESVSNKYALTLLELKRYDEAERVLSGSLSLHPGSANTNVHLGRLRLRKRAWESAKRAYLDALQVNPFDPEVQVGLFVAANALGDSSTAIRAQAAGTELLSTDVRGFEAMAKRFAGLDDLAKVDDVLFEAKPDAGQGPRRN